MGREGYLNTWEELGDEKVFFEMLLVDGEVAVGCGRG